MLFPACHCQLVFLFHFIISVDFILFVEFFSYFCCITSKEKYLYFVIILSHHNEPYRDNKPFLLPNDPDTETDTDFSIMIFFEILSIYHYHKIQPSIYLFKYKKKFKVEPITYVDLEPMLNLISGIIFTWYKMNEMCLLTHQLFVEKAMMLVMKARMARMGVTVLRMLLDPGLLLTLLLLLFWPTLTIIGHSKKDDHTAGHLQHHQWQYSLNMFLWLHIEVYCWRGFTILTVSHNMISIHREEAKYYWLHSATHLKQW